MTDLKIEAGKYYRTRDGKKVGPMGERWPAHFKSGRWGVYGVSRQWNDEGRMWSEYGGATDGDLVAEWRDGPDLTAIKTPFGLLDREAQEALKAHGGPYEMWAGDGWSHHPSPAWDGWYAYRVKPAPPKLREFWINVYAGAVGGPYSVFESEQRAIDYAQQGITDRIHVIEKLPE